MALNWGVLAFFLAALAGGLLYFARRLRRSLGIPQGQVIEADTDGWEMLAQPLAAPSLKLVGRPDYVVNDGVDVIPIEIKSHPAPRQPYPSQVMQLAAYCALVTETYGRRPGYGILHYADRTFEIPYTPVLETQLRETLAEMREAMQAGGGARNHRDPGRCQGCLYRAQCPDALGK
jgi:CRISPR-associated exonuclease Cas4